MKRVALAVGVLMTAASATFVPLAGPASAAVDPCAPEYDITPPSYSQLSVSPNEFVLGKTAKKLTVSLKVTDNCGIGPVSGAPPINIAFRPAANLKGNVAITMFNFTRVSGTATSGTWKSTQTLDKYLPAGTWKLVTVRIFDINGNNKVALSGPGLHIRRATWVSIHASKSSVKKNKKFTLYGTLAVSNLYKHQTIQVQTRKPGGRSWSTLKTITTNVIGKYSTEIKVDKTKYYRVVHPENSTTEGAVSSSVKVKKK